LKQKVNIYILTQGRVNSLFIKLYMVFQARFGFYGINFTACMSKLN
jgi:hypothetical protein